jgi:hypothetical protein
MSRSGVPVFICLVWFVMSMGPETSAVPGGGLSVGSQRNLSNNFGAARLRLQF